ncbi:hypothetical protein MASR1M65_11710 [Saprospiraceae bacterium]
MYLLNKEPFLANGHVIIRESEGLSSPVASLFFEYYDKISDVAAKLAALKDKLQVVISKPLHEFNSVIQVRHNILPLMIMLMVSILWSSC